MAALAHDGPVLVDAVAPKWSSPRPRGYDRDGRGSLYMVSASIGGRTDELIDPGGTMRPTVVSSAPSCAMTDVNLYLFEEAAPRW